MNTNLFLCFVLVSFVSKEINVASGFFDVFGLVESTVSLVDMIKGFVNPDDGHKQTEEITEKIITSVNAKIEASNQNLYADIKQTLDLIRIDDIIFDIHSVMEDLLVFFNATKDDKEAKKREFIRQASTIISDIKSLPLRLRRTLSNSEKSLLLSMADKLHCNLTVMEEFEMFYRNLIENGIIIELTYKYLEYPNASDSAVKLYWNKQETIISADFCEQKAVCQAKLNELIKADIEQSNEIETLSITLRMKYNCLVFDVFFLESKNAEQSLYVEGQIDDFIEIESNGVRKVVRIVEKGTKLTELDLQCVVLQSNKDTNTSLLFNLDPESPGWDYDTTTTNGSSIQHTTFFYNTVDRHCPSSSNYLLEGRVTDSTDDNNESRGLHSNKLLVLLYVVLSYLEIF